MECAANEEESRRYDGEGIVVDVANRAPTTANAPPSSNRDPLSSSAVAVCARGSQQDNVRIKRSTHNNVNNTEILNFE